MRNFTSLVHRLAHLRLPLLLFSGYVLLMMSWLVSNPPGATADEPSHFVKALGVGQGDWSGSPADLPPEVAVGPMFGSETFRTFDIPARLWTPRFACNANKPEKSAQCLLEPPPREPGSEMLMMPSVVGSYQPFIYVAAGLVAPYANGPMNAVRLARLTNAALCLALLLLAILVLWDPGHARESLLGLMLAVTPMAVFMAASFNPSGPEIFGAMCTLAGLIRLQRGESRVALAWGAIGAGGSVLALSRPTGPLWLGIFGIAAVLFLTPRRAWELVREGRRTSILALSSVGACVIANVLWKQSVQLPNIVRNPTEFASFSSSFTEMRGALSHLVGVFGYLDTVAPYLAHTIWLAVAGGICLIAQLVGTRRQRLAFGLICLGATLIVACLLAFWLRRWGIGLQGRYVLPLVVGIPLCAAEIVRTRHFKLGELWPKHIGSFVGLTVASIHLMAWYTNSRRHAVGTNGPMWFLGREEWTPPWGYIPWAVLAIGGAAAIAIFGFKSSRIP